MAKQNQGFRKDLNLEEVDIETAAELNKIFLEIVCAPSFSDGALEILKKKKNAIIIR